MTDDAADQPRHRKAPSREARRLEIVAAARRELLDHGYEAAKLDRVALQAGVAKGTLYLYFPNKAELFKAVVRDSLLPRVEAMAAQGTGMTGPATDLLGAQLAMFRDGLKSPELRGLIHLVISEAPRFPDIADFYRNEVMAVGLAGIRKVVRYGIERGEFRDAGLEEFPQILMGPVMITLIWKTLFGERAPLDADRLMERWLDLLLDGLRAR